MAQFIKISTQILAADRISNIDRNANINGATGVEISLHGNPFTFQYTGPYAQEAADKTTDVEPTQAPPVSKSPLSLTFVEGEAPVPIKDIEWVDLDAQIGTSKGVEVRVASDAPGVTRKYTLKQASEAYDNITEGLGFPDATAAA